MPYDITYNEDTHIWGWVYLSGTTGQWFISKAFQSEDDARARRATLHVDSEIPVSARHNARGLVGLARTRLLEVLMAQRKNLPDPQRPPRRGWNPDQRHARKRNFRRHNRQVSRRAL